MLSTGLFSANSRCTRRTRGARQTRRLPLLRLLCRRNSVQRLRLQLPILPPLNNLSFRRNDLLFRRMLVRRLPPLPLDHHRQHRIGQSHPLQLHLRLDPRPTHILHCERRSRKLRSHHGLLRLHPLLLRTHPAHRAQIRPPTREEDHAEDLEDGDEADYGKLS